MKKSRLLIFCSLVGLSLNSQTFVKGGFASSSYGSPRNLINVNGTLFFEVDDGINGNELWKSDGTTAGTTIIKDLTPGSTGTIFSATKRVVFNNELYFYAYSSANGDELWKSDGTNSGTSLVKDISTGTNSSNGSVSGTDLLVPSGTLLFFNANDGINGSELWKSDGTLSGTSMVKDIFPGSSANESSPTNLCDLNGTLFFSAYNPTSGYELWKSDGTAAGTVLVKDINPGTSSSSPNFLINVNGTLFFFASNGVSGNELWKSDGTSAGTVLVKDINPGANASNNGNYGLTYLVNGNGILYFYANDGSTGYELWKSDGTTAGTTLVKDINSGTATSMATGTGGPLLNFINNNLFFRASNGINGMELWTSDGTSAGTVMVKDIFPGSNSSYPTYITQCNNTCYFVSGQPNLTSQLCKSDGTSAGTYSLFISASDPYPSSLTNVNGTLFFRAYSNINGEGLWKLDPNTTSLNDNIVLPGDIKIFPNPSTGSFIIETQSNNSIEITNPLGEKILTQELSQGKNEVNLRTHPNGIYFIRVNQLTYKIVKQ